MYIYIDTCMHIDIWHIICPDNLLTKCSGDFLVWNPRQAGCRAPRGAPRIEWEGKLGLALKHVAIIGME